MSVEKRAFSGPNEDFTDEAPEQSPSERQDLSIISASELLYQIEHGEDFALNEYQQSCEYAVLYDAASNNSDRIWENVDTPSGLLEFRQGLQELAKKNDVSDLKIYFLDSIYDFPLEVAPGDQDPQTGALFVTPDGVRYRRKYTQDDSGKFHMQFVIDTDRMPTSEVRRQAERVREELKQKGWGPHSYFKPFNN